MPGQDIVLALPDVIHCPSIGVPVAWFTADDEFGQNPGLRAYLEKAGISYVMAIAKITTYADTDGPRHR